MAYSFSKPVQVFRKGKKDPARYMIGSGMIFAMLGLILIIGLVLVLTSDKLAALKQFRGQEPQTAVAQTAAKTWTDAQGGQYLLKIGEQAAGQTVKIGELKLAEKSWIVIHADKDGQPGSVISAYRFNAGKVKDFEMGLISSASLEAGKTYHAMIHSENGDSRFTSAVDQPVKDSAGNPMVVMFAVK